MWRSKFKIQRQKQNEFHSIIIITIDTVAVLLYSNDGWLNSQSVIYITLSMMEHKQQWMILISSVHPN